MAEPKWVNIWELCKYRWNVHTYATVQGVDRIIPVDMIYRVVLQDLKLYSMQ